MKKFLLTLFLLTITLNFSNLYAADAIGGITLEENFKLAKKFPMPSAWLLSVQCSACHGTMGAEFDDIIPPLAGIDKDEFIKKMQEYKTKDASEFIVMGIIAQPITDEEIVAMAEFFSKQKSVPWSQETAQKDVVVPEWAKMNTGEK